MQLQLGIDLLAAHVAHIRVFHFLHAFIAAAVTTGNKGDGEGIRHTHTALLVADGGDTGWSGSMRQVERSLALPGTAHGR